MKTLTELSGTQVRMAAAAIAEARRSLPKDEEAAAPAAPAAADAPATADAEATPEPAAAGGETAVPASPAPSPPASPKPGAGAESDAVKAALDAAVAKATGLSGERLAMLRAAVEAAGRRVEDVRLVRVFGPEEPVPGATKVGGHQYLVDLFPTSMKQVAGGGREDRGRRGGRGGGGGRGGKGAPATGGFSMDSLREDRRNERGRGRPGAGRRPGPGGPPRGGPPGGGEKK